MTLDPCPECGALPCDWVDNPHPPSGSELPTWPELSAYWKVRAEAALAALTGIRDDYMTSEQHHPGYVLIPAERFDALCKAADGSVVGLWRPIFTADKTREVLLWCAETGEQFVAFWGTDPKDGDQQWVFARGNGISFVVRDPTHWRPLDAGPANQAEGASPEVESLG